MIEENPANSMTDREYCKEEMEGGGEKEWRGTGWVQVVEMKGKEPPRKSEK